MRWVWVLLAALTLGGLGAVALAGPDRGREQIGCGGQSKVQAGDHEHTVRVGLRRRQYILHVPPQLPAGRCLPVVLNFHGGGLNAESQMTLSGMNEVADESGFLVVYPQGTAIVDDFRTWNAGSCCGAAERKGIDDVAFVGVIIDDLGGLAPIDRRRVFATGMSNGAMMTYRLACELSDRIASIAPVAGTLGVDDCRSGRAVSVLHVHGTDDRFAPLNGGVGRIRESGAFRSVAETIDVMAALARCDAESRVTFERGDVRCTERTGCKRADVVLCLVNGGGHTWPGGAPFPEGGATTHDISASRAMWRFFERHPLPVS